MYSFSEMLFITVTAFITGASVTVFVKEFMDDLKEVEKHKKGGVFEPIELGVEEAKEIKGNVYVGNGYDCDTAITQLQYDVIKLQSSCRVLDNHDKAIELLFLPELDIKDFEVIESDEVRFPHGEVVLPVIKTLKSKEIDLDEFRSGRDRYVKVDSNGYDVDYYLYERKDY